MTAHKNIVKVNYNSATLSAHFSLLRVCVTVYDTYSVDGVVVGMYFNLQNIKFPGIKSRRGVACRPYKSLLRPNNEYFRKTDYVIIRPLLHSLLDGG